jgi:hypothetical protein|tara:strand:- start:304127 stop:304921 length:795 start_codon:yes stop_codon:yes gene_type:complete
MGKVGSTSIYDSLKLHSSLFNTIHVHTLNNKHLKNREHYIKKEVYKDNNYSRHIYTHLLWKPQWINKLLKKINKPIKIITVVREPISRNISLFFQWIDFEETKDSYIFKSRNNKYPFTIETEKDNLTGLYDIFLNHFTSNSHNEWLREELFNVFNKNLLAVPFDKDKGFSIIQKEGFNLLTLKLEMLDHTFENAMEDFIEERITLVKANEANTKNIKEIYSRFKTEIRFPKSYIDNILDSQYVQHFYTLKEIETFKLKWYKQSF